MLIVLSISLAGCGADGLRLPALRALRSGQVDGIAWDTGPSALVVRLYSPYTTAGLAGAFDDRYYVPEVQIWGDGRIIWVAREGRYVGGETLAFAWELINRKPTAPTYVTYEGQAYRIMVQVPGVSFFDPPRW